MAVDFSEQIAILRPSNKTYHPWNKPLSWMSPKRTTKIRTLYPAPKVKTFSSTPRTSSWSSGAPSPNSSYLSSENMPSLLLREWSWQWSNCPQSARVSNHRPTKYHRLPMYHHSLCPQIAPKWPKYTSSRFLSYRDFYLGGGGGQKLVTKIVVCAKPWILDFLWVSENGYEALHLNAETECTSPEHYYGNKSPALMADTEVWRLTNSVARNGDVRANNKLVLCNKIPVSRKLLSFSFTKILSINPVPHFLIPPWSKWANFRIFRPKLVRDGENFDPQLQTPLLHEGCSKNHVCFASRKKEYRRSYSKCVFWKIFEITYFFT